MTRFSQTDKWKDPWFRSLKAGHKLVFLYVVDNCNNAGFYEIDEGMMVFQTGISATQIAAAWQGLARGLVGAGGWVWVKRFLRHQKNENLNPNNNAHLQIINLVKEQVSRFQGSADFAEFLGANEGLFSPPGNVTYSKGNVEKGVQGEKQTLPSFVPDAFRNSIEFEKAWSEWLTHCAEVNRPLRSAARNAQLKQLIDAGLERSIAVIQGSIGKQSLAILYFDFDTRGANGKSADKPKIPTGQHGPIRMV